MPTHLSEGKWLVSAGVRESTTRQEEETDETIVAFVAPLGLWIGGCWSYRGESVAKIFMVKVFLAQWSEDRMLA